MKTTIQWKRFASFALFLSLTWMLCLQPIDTGRTQDKTGDAASASPRAENSLDLRGDVPNPQRIGTIELRTPDSHDPAKEIVYSGTPLVEVLKAGGLRLDAGETGIRETVKMTVLVEAADGYQAAFSLAELDPEFTDRVTLLADTKDGQPLSSREGPFRIIVPNEKRPTRWVRQVKAVTVRKD